MDAKTAGSLDGAGRQNEENRPLLDKRAIALVNKRTNSLTKYASTKASVPKIASLQKSVFSLVRKRARSAGFGNTSVAETSPTAHTGFY